MIDELDLMVEAVDGLSSRAILLIGPPRSGKSELLLRLAQRRGADVLNVGAALGRGLLTVAEERRRAEAMRMLDELAAAYATRGLLLMDNIELLFDRTLRLDPVPLVRRQARSWKVVASWPGELSGGRLTYAQPGHPEHASSPSDGVLTFATER